jgi:hypothetical protein
MFRPIALFVIGSCLMASPALASIVTGDKIDIDRVHQNSNSFDTTPGAYGTEVTYGGVGGGGEFLVREIVGSTLSWDGAFKTFCIEYSEHIGLGGDYWATIDSNALNGGPGAGPLGDPVDDATKWLYGAYVRNELSGISLLVDVAATTKFSYDNENWSNALQLAIWYLEGETGAPGLGSNNQAKNLVKTALANASSNKFDVKALNLWTTRSGNATSGYTYTGGAQSQLIYLGELPEDAPVPTPEPGSLVIFGALGMLGVFSFRRGTHRNAA